MAKLILGNIKGKQGEVGKTGQPGATGKTGETGATGLVMVNFLNTSIEFSEVNNYVVHLPSVDYFNRTPIDGEKVVGFFYNTATNEQAICRNCTVNYTAEPFRLTLSFVKRDYIVITGAQGEQGQQGEAGRGVASVEIVDDNLVFGMTDNTTETIPGVTTTTPDEVGIDTTPTENSANVITSGGVYNALKDAGVEVYLTAIDSEGDECPETIFDGELFLVVYRKAYSWQREPRVGDLVIHQFDVPNSKGQNQILCRMNSIDYNSGIAEECEGITLMGGHLPQVTATDKGKFLRVNDYGQWEAQAVPSAEGMSV